MNAATNDNFLPAPTPAAIDAPSARGAEIWSGKDKADENFPVGSLLIAKPLRPHIHAFYAFARNADDIADSDALSPDEKITRLNLMESVLSGAADDPISPSAGRLRKSLAQTGVPAIHARELLVAFRQDAVKTRYESWAELIDYCRYSAAPVGRYVLDLHGEDRKTWPPSDALCAALQILNHLQDGAADLRALDRCYIPQDWLQKNNTSTDDLARNKLSPGLHVVFANMLAETQKLNGEAARLPALCKSRRLRVETAIIANLARRLTRRLENQDPLAMRVKLSKLDFFAAILSALPRAAQPRFA